MATSKFKPTTKKAVQKTINLVASATASPYNILIPIKGARYVWVKHPARTGIRHLDVKSEEFTNAMLELFKSGFGVRIAAELEKFAAADPQWAAVSLQLAENLTALGYVPAESEF